VFYLTGPDQVPTLGRPKDVRLIDKWVQAFFNRDSPAIWCEPPITPENRQFDMWQYRVFIDDAGVVVRLRSDAQVREFHEAGWRTYTDLRAEREGSATR
jgi:hypothetical protein